MKKLNRAKNEILPFLVKEKKLTPVILGILIVIAGFATFNIFNKFAPGTIQTEEQNTEENDTIAANSTKKPKQPKIQQF